MDNPYEAPQRSGLAGEIDGGATASERSSPKASIFDYVMALISGVFVTFGVMIVVAFSQLFFGSWVASAPRLVIAAIPFGAIGLGILSAWQSLRQAKRRAHGKLRDRTD